jgi:hypothetical protein
MKFCPVVPEICRGQVHVPKKERRKRIKRIIIIIIIRNGAKTIINTDDQNDRCKVITIPHMDLSGPGKLKLLVR